MMEKAFEKIVSTQIGILEEESRRKKNSQEARSEKKSRVQSY